jgi:hypothetical protein
MKEISGMNESKFAQYQNLTTRGTRKNERHGSWNNSVST